MSIGNENKFKKYEKLEQGLDNETIPSWRFMVCNTTILGQHHHVIKFVYWNESQIWVPKEKAVKYPSSNHNFPLPPPTNMMVAASFSFNLLHSYMWK